MNKQTFRFSSSSSSKEFPRPVGYGGWKSEPTTRGRDHGIQFRMERLKCLGNSVVPIQAKKAFDIIRKNN